MLVDFPIIYTCSCDYYLKTDFSLPLLPFQVSLEHELGLLTDGMGVNRQLWVRPREVWHCPYPEYYKQLQQIHGLSYLNRFYNFVVVEPASSLISILLFFYSNRVLGGNVVAQLKTVSQPPLQLDVVM